jgi:hypothetical protein
MEQSNAVFVYCVAQPPEGLLLNICAVNSESGSKLVRNIGIIAKEGRPPNRRAFWCF